MLLIDPALLDIAAEKLCIAARRARDSDGRLVAVRLPMSPPAPATDGSPLIVSSLDRARIHAVALAAVKELTGVECVLGDGAASGLDARLAE